MKDETTGVFIQHSLMRSGLRDAGGEAVQGLLHARAENALRQRNTDPDIRVDVQGNDSVEGYGGRGADIYRVCCTLIFIFTWTKYT